MFSSIIICIFWRVLDMKGFQIFGDPWGSLQCHKISHGHQRLNASTQQDLTGQWRQMGRWGGSFVSAISKSAKGQSRSHLRAFETWLVTWWSSFQPSYWGTSLPAWRYEASEIWESPHKRTSGEVWQISVSRIANYHQLPSFTTESGTLARQWWPNHRHLAKWDASNITSWFWVDFLHNLQLSSAALVINQFSLKRLGRPLQNSSLNQTQNRSQDRQRTTRRWVHQTPLPRLSSCHILFRKTQC